MVSAKEITDMDVQAWTFIIVGITFALYIAIAIMSRAGSTGEFYVAGKGVSPLANGLATAADWMSAASFLGMAGSIAFGGMDGSVFLMGWTGGYVLLALLLAPYLRKFGKFTVPDFMGDRYYSRTARLVSVICAIFISFTYIAGQMRGVGVVFSRFLEVDIDLGVIIGMCLVFFYAVLGGMKGITYTQVAQYCVLIFAYTIPAIFLAFMVTGNPVPQLALGGTDADGVGLLTKLNSVLEDLGFSSYTDYHRSMLDVVFITAALMLGTAGLPHVIIRFYTVKRVRDARTSAGWALLFIAILYTTAPAIAVFARGNMLATVPNVPYAEAPSWVKTWEDTGLIAWSDHNQDGIIQHTAGAPFKGKPVFVQSANGENDQPDRGAYGQRLLANDPIEGAKNELYVDKDIIVLANPEIAGLPNWVIALVAAGGLAAALSTAAGLLMVISSAVSHDLVKRTFRPDITEKQELRLARIAAACAVVCAGLLGIWPPDYVAQVVAFAFGLAASSFFPAILMGIFWKRMNAPGAIAGMIAGIVFTASYIIWFNFIDSDRNTSEYWWFGISPTGIGTLGMLLNFIVSIPVCLLTSPPPQEVQEMVERIRVPVDG